MRVVVAVPLIIVGATGLGCGSDDSPPASAQRSVSVARYARSFDTFCARLDRANRQAGAMVQAAADRGGRDVAPVLAATKRAQGTVVEVFARETDRLAAIAPPERFATFHEQFRTENPKVVSSMRTALRNAEAATTFEELGAARSGGADTTGPELPDGLVARAPACGRLANTTSSAGRSADQKAKSSARNAVSQVESCFTETTDYAECTTPESFASGAVTIARGTPRAGEVSVSKATRTGYRILAPSASGNRFAITRQGTRMIRSCSAKTETGGCQNGRW